MYDNELSQCDDLDASYMEANDGITSFNLTAEDVEITGPTNTSWVVTYYETQADAQANTGAITNPTNYTNTITGPQTLYVRVTDSDTTCSSFTTVTIRVLPNPSPSPDPTDLELCDDVNIVGPNDLLEVFDLTQNEAFIINGEAGVSASYYLTQNDAIMGSNAIADPSMHTNEDPAAPGVAVTPQTIYVRLTNGTDPSGTSGTGCYSLVNFDIIVNPLPVVTPVDDYIICELNTDNIAAFDLESMTTAILNGQDPTVFTVTYHETQGEADTAMNALSSPYNNTSDPQTIYVNITNTTTGCDTAMLTFDLRVDEAAQANPDGAPIRYEACDDSMEFDGDTTNDRTVFDLTTQNPFVLDGQNPGSYTVSYYANQTDADAATNALPLAYTNITNPQVIIARVDNDIMIPDGMGGMLDSSTCYETAEVTLQVNPMPSFTLAAEYLLCINTNGTEVINSPLIDTELDATLYTFQWRLGGAVLPNETGASLAPTIGGVYSVIVTNTTTGCESIEVSTLVMLSEPPIVTAEVTSLAFANQHDIVVTATGTTTTSIAIYEFSIDGGSWETNTPNDSMYTFSDVAAGEHTITVRDTIGCGETTIAIMVMDYPLYFTPNGDGYHDTWNIHNIGTQPDAVIYIFNKFGKLLKQLSPLGAGWDGTYNGNPLPTSDYWFTLEYREPSTDEKKMLKGHFTLKR
jgi:gliding motility-associated-like protein